MPAHVAVFMSSLMTGGAERMMLGLTRGMAARAGVRVSLVLVARKGPLVADIPAGLDVAELGTASRPAVWASLARLPGRTLRCAAPALLAGGKMPSAVRALPRLVGWLREMRPDGLLTTLAYNNLVGLWAASLVGGETRVVVREANTVSREHAAATRPLDRRLPALVGLWYPSAAAVVAVSDGVASDLVTAAGVARDRITTIHNPIDVDRVAALAQARVAAPLDPGWFAADAPPVIVAVGRLAPQKDYPTLLRAFARVRTARPARLVILGEGGERPKLEALAAELGVVADVRLPGAVDNPFIAVRRAALFVLSSAWEGFPNVLLEALACGCPIVATDCPSGPRELLEGGIHGRLVPVGDAAALAGAIDRALDAPRGGALLVARAREFSPEVALERYLALLLPGETAGRVGVTAATG